MLLRNKQPVGYAILREKKTTKKIRLVLSSIFAARTQSKYIKCD